MKTLQLFGFGLAASALFGSPLPAHARGDHKDKASEEEAASHERVASGGRSSGTAARSPGPQTRGEASAAHNFGEAHHRANAENSAGFHAPGQARVQVVTPPYPVTSPARFLATGERIRVITPQNPVTSSTVTRIYSGPRNAPVVTTSSTSAVRGAVVITTRTPQIQTRAAIPPNGGWDRAWDRIWHGRHYHWNSGAWVIINDGFYPYTASYYAPSSPDVYPNASYEYDSAPAPSAIAAPAPMPTVAEDSIAADVQASLQRLGYYHGEITGEIGDLTRGAIADFQRDNDLPITGYITKSLLKALGL